MSYSLEEIAVIFVVLVTILILSLFFGLFWAVLLVFTLLWLLYNFGRENVRKKAVKTSVSHDIDSKQDDFIDGEMYSKGGMDVPFTGIPSPKVQSVRSPMPLLSVVTKRLSFNTSSFSPRENSRSVYRRSFGSPSPSVSQQSPSRHFSLINPKFQQQQPTIKIAPPPVERLVPVQEEAKESIQDPLSRSTILSALKQSTARKRSAYEEDDDADFIIAQSANTNKRRRYNYPTYSENENPTVETTALDVTQDVIVNQSKTNNHSVSKQDVTEDKINPPVVVRVPGISALIQTRLKRRPLHSTDDGDEVKEALSKKKRQESHLQKTKEIVSQKTSSPQVKPTERDHSAEPGSECTSSKTNEEFSKQLSGSKSKTVYMHNDGDSDSGCDADDDDDIVMKSIPLQTERPAKRRGIDDDGSPVKSTGSPSTYKRAPTNTTPVGGRRVSKQQMMSHAIAVTSSPARQLDSPDSTASQKNTPKKRFSILRFPSKNSEAKRRSVPVYCASVDSPDLHKRQPVSHKITKQDIEMDRKLAWKRIQSFLDTSDDEEDKKDNKNTVTSPSVAINVVTCLAVSPPRSTSSTSSATTQGGLFSGTLTNSTVQSAGVPSTTGTSIHPLKLSSNTLQIKPQAQDNTTSSTAATTAPSATNTITLGITPIALTVGGSKTQTLVSSGITIGAPAISQSNDISNPTTLSSFTLSSQSLQAPITSPALTSTSPQVQFGQKTSSTENPLLTGPPVSTSLQVNQKTTSQGLSSNLSLTGTFPSSNLVSRGLTVTNSTQAGSINVTETTSRQQTSGLGTNLPQLGSSNITNPLQVGSMSSNPLGSGPSALTGGPNAKSQAGLNISKPSGSSLFSGLTGNTSTPGVPLGTMAANSVGPSASSSPFTFGTKTTDSNVGNSQLAPKVLNFGAAQTPTTNIFGPSSGSVSGSLQQPSKNSFVSILTSQGGINGSTFGQSSSTQQTAKDDKPAFSFVTQTAAQSTASTNSLTAFGGKNPTTQSPFGMAATQKAIGATTTQNTFGTTSTLSKFGANTSQNTFGATPSQNAFGATTSQNPFGATKQIGFGTSTSQNTFGAGTNQNAFASPATAPSQNIFSSGNTANPAKPAFGSSASQGAFDKPAVGGFGSTSTQSTFGSQTASTGGLNFASNKPATTPNTGGFNFSTGASTGGTSTSAGFNFGTSNSNSSSGGFSFGSGGASTNTAPSSGGFNFGTGASKSTGGFNFANTGGNTPSNSTPGGFNFGNTSSAKPAGGFAFGSPATSGGFQFGAAQQNTPTPAPTFGSPAVQNTGFNFGGGSAKPAFGATTGTPGGFAFGASSQTPSSSVAKSRIKATARRRPRK